MSPRSGRPKQDNSSKETTRANLIDAARQCFAQQAYEKVSTRHIAKTANVDAAMIRYYFGSKAGLFRVMIEETIAPVLAQFQKDFNPDVSLSPLHLMQTYYRMIANTPMLPRLIQQVLNEENDSEAFQIMTSIIQNIIKTSGKWIQFFVENQQINPNLNPDWIRLSFVSLMVFPILAPEYVRKQLKVDITEECLLPLAQHNHTLLEQGLFNFTHQEMPPKEKNHEERSQK